MHWLTKKIEEIFSAVKEATQWCWTKVKELFGFLHSLFNN